MYQIDVEKMKVSIIGEVVRGMINDNIGLTKDTLVKQLAKSIINEQYVYRRQIIKCIISDIEHSKINHQECCFLDYLK